MNGSGDWDSPEYKDTTEVEERRNLKLCDEEGNPILDDLEVLLDFDFDEMPQIETDLPPMVCKMGKGSRYKNKIKENIMYFIGAGPSSSVGTSLTQKEVEKWALAYSISMRYEMLEEADKVTLDGNIKPEEERALLKVKGKMIKEKKYPRAFIFPIRLEGLINENALVDIGSDINTMPYRIYEQLGRDDIIKEDRNITMINYIEAKVIGRLVNVLCQIRFTTLSAKFLILEITVDQDAPIMVGHGFLDTIRGNIDIPCRILTTFDGLSRQTFRAARSEKIRIAENDSDDEEDYTSRAYDHEAESSRLKRSRHVETVEEALLPNVHHEFLEWSGCSRETRSHYNTRLAILLPKLIYSSHIVDWQLLHKIGCGEEIDQMLKISLKEAKSNEEILFYVAWVRAFNIQEPIYPKLCREFYATYQFDEVCADDELQSKKIISFRLGGRAHNLTLLEFARRLGLYHAEELDEDGFNTYFQGGLRSDKNFNAREYWERISTNGHQNGYANVAWVIAKWMERKRAGSQKVSHICYGLFISKIARKSRVLTEEIVRTLSTPVYCRDLDRTTLRELIDSEDRFIPDIPVDDVLRVSAQRAPRVLKASMQDLYKRMGSMEIRQEAIKRMEYRHAYHWDSNMDSSMGKMCLGQDAIEISSDQNEGSGDWDSPEYKDTVGNGEINLEKNDNLILNNDAFKLCLKYEIETDLLPMVCKMGKGSQKKKIMENIMYFNGARPSPFVRTPLTQEEAEKWALAHSISMRYEMLEEVRLVINQMLKISLKEAESNEEIFFSVAWVRAFNIREPIYPELCHEFYATYEFAKVCADDELHSKKIISFRLGGRTHNLTLFEFARRLGLYHAEELDEEGFDTYFKGGLRSDENFNAREYWERISTNGDLHLSRSSITSMKRNGAGSQKDSQICCGQFISKIPKKSRVLKEEIVRTLSTPVYCRDLDRTTLRELIDSEDRLIPDILVDDVLRVAS
uniref:Uncharacterized protein n=1 Tax=Tanacetum cinerariifolium TaxID=118510 RepID=A0A6L2KT72_TANCI|nr:hypothetical protein [Tanacetum cinerariifolium]